MNNIDIGHISPHVVSYYSWRNSRNVKLHYNKFSQYYRIVRFIKGSCEFVIDNTSYVCNEKNIFFCPPAVKYSAKVTSDDILMFNIFFDMTWNADSADTVLPSKTLSVTAPKEDRHYFFTDYPVFNEPQIFDSEATLSILNKILREIDLTRPLSHEYIDLYIHQLFLCIARERSSQNNDLKNDFSQNIIDYIAKNVNSDIDVNSIAAKFTYHPNYIARIMKKATGMSLHRYILDTKLKVAENLLCTTDYNIIDIAMMLSFSNSSHFSQKFKQKYKMTPSEYRKKYS